MVEGLTWDCSDEFDATSEQPISFLSDQSFISFPNWISRTGAMVSFKVNISKVSTVYKCTSPEMFFRSKRSLRWPCSSTIRARVRIKILWL